MYAQIIFLNVEKVISMRGVLAACVLFASSIDKSSLNSKREIFLITINQLSTYELRLAKKIFSMCFVVAMSKFYFIDPLSLTALLNI